MALEKLIVQNVQIHLYQLGNVNVQILITFLMKENVWKPVINLNISSSFIISVLYQRIAQSGTAVKEYA